MLKIHYAPRTRGLRVAWLCEEMGLPYEVVPVGFPPDAAYRALNPIGALPFLQDGDVAINESTAMLLYIAQKYGPTPLLPGKDSPALARALQFLVFGEATIGMSINQMMGARFFAPDADKDNWTVRRSEERTATAIQYTADMLGRDQYLAGDHFTVADISVSYAVNIWAGMFQKTIPANLEEYQRRVMARPAYQRAVAAK
jgi:glutathione S-transferase